MAVLVLFLIFAAPRTEAQIAPGIARFKSSSSNAAAQTQVVKKIAAQLKSAHTTPAAVVALTIAGSTVTYKPIDPFAATISTSSKEQDLILHNSSTTVQYTLDTAAITGANAADFKITTCTSKVLSIGNTDCTIELSYTTATAGSSSAVLNIALSGSDGSSAAVTIPLIGNAYSACTALPGYTAYLRHNFFPLSHSDIDSATINCYYNTGSNLAFATQVQYRYNPAGSANVVSGDLASFQFTGGWQMTFAGTATTSSCGTTPAGGGSASATNTTCGSVAGTATPTLQQDVQSLMNGGDFSLRAQYPAYNWRGKGMQLIYLVTPKVGFTVNGLTSQATATNATEINSNVAQEAYFQLDALPATEGGDSPASLYVDYRGGWEHVSSAFAAAATLPGNNFYLQQFSAGLVIGSGIRISAERYKGPNQLYVDPTGAATPNNFANWQFRVQFTPASIAGK